MDSPYSPLTTGTAPPPGHSLSPSASHSPPLVPIPPPDNQSPYDPHYRHPSSHSQRYDPYSDPAHSRNPSFPPQSAPGGPRRDPYARDDWQQQQHQQHYHQGYHQPRPDYPPPVPQDSFYRSDPYYRQPPPPQYGYPPRDPYYSAPPPPPPPRDPSYNNHGPPQPRDLYGYPAGPPPAHSRGYPPPIHHAPPPVPPQAPIPTGPTAISLGPHPIHGILTPETDLSIPLLYLARPVSTKTFAPLRHMFPHLELRFVNSLLELSSDLHRANLEDSELSEEVKDKRRRVWVTAVGGTDALVNRVRANTEEKLEWREIIDLNHLTIELGFEDRRVVELIREREEEEMRAAHPEPEEDEEREKGRREIEQLERDQNGLDGGQVEELDRVLRAVRGEKERMNEVGGGGEYETSPEPTRLATSRNGERGEAVVDRFEDMVKREHHEEGGGSNRAKSMEVEEEGGARGGGETSRSRKRSRHESEEDHDHSASRAARKKLEAICKAPRRSCVEWANEHSVPITEETRLVDQEPVLGERHRGVWDLFSHELDDISPQIQVLMARALRDVTYPDRLKLYSNPEAFEQLNETVPWFTTLLKNIETRFELVGASSVVPMDPPAAEEPFEELTANDIPAPPTSTDRPDAPRPETVAN